MSILFIDERSSTRAPRRSTTGLWLSVVVHGIFVVLLIVVPMRASETASTLRGSIGMFVFPATELVKLPSAAVVAPRLSAPPVPPPPVRELARAEVPEPPPAAPIVAKRVEPVPEPLVPEAPAPTRPEIQRPPEVGLFDRTNGARPSQAAADVATGGFGSAAAAARVAASGSGAVATGGFGNGASALRRTANGAGVVQTAGFDLPASAPVQPHVAASMKPIDRPVEIVFKPTPEYTDEARGARIEGTVSLELEFAAAGDVRVLRVVRGLGHGLDEAAERAALRIRFKPAQSDGRPVDSRATVHITFRLS
jgi:TonB family protein